ncbi:MAG: hypothetical protein LBL46_04100 [Rickettsiales bacterium]|jgi:hypothetical protein|nr:hypothetical protein [Rickettsiales bacterium]
MKKLYRGILLLIAHCSLLVAVAPARAVEIADDTADPMFLEKFGDFVSRTSADFGKYFQAREIASYGYSDRFAVDLDLRWRSGGNNKKDDDPNNDFKDGFSNLGVMGKYRAGKGDTGATDILFGFGFGGRDVVPNYSDEVYSVGMRTGRQWQVLTLSATVLTNWIFDREHGIAYIDLTPEAYFRLVGDWSFGAGATFRKSTTTIFDQTWINAKLGTQIGKTGWYLNGGYETKSKDLRIGGSIYMLF